MLIVAIAAAYVSLASLEVDIPVPPPTAERIADFICENDVDAARAGIYFANHGGDVTTDEMESRFAGQCSYRAVDVKPPGVSIEDTISLDNVELRVMRIPTTEGDRWMYQFVLHPTNSLTR
jgi:hypothetical protein